MCALFLTACGYRCGSGEVCSRYSSVCVPYVEGDREGLLTSALIRRLSSTALLTYKSQNADLILKACFLPSENINIGFEYAPADKSDNFSSNIVVANEGRLTLGSKWSWSIGAQE